jgi:hypothetical protein
MQSRHNKRLEFRYPVRQSMRVSCQPAVCAAVDEHSRTSRVVRLEHLTASPLCLSHTHTQGCGLVCLCSHASCAYWVALPCFASEIDPWRNGYTNKLYPSPHLLEGKHHVGTIMATLPGTPPTDSPVRLPSSEDSVADEEADDEDVATQLWLAGQRGGRVQKLQQLFDKMRADVAARGLIRIPSVEQKHLRHRCIDEAESWPCTAGTCFRVLHISNFVSNHRLDHGLHYSCRACTLACGTRARRAKLARRNAAKSNTPSNEQSTAVAHTAESTGFDAVSVVSSTPTTTQAPPSPSLSWNPAKFRSLHARPPIGHCPADGDVDPNLVPPPFYKCDLSVLSADAWAAPKVDLVAMEQKFGYKIHRLPVDPVYRVPTRVYLKVDGWLCKLSSYGDIHSLCAHGHKTRCCYVPGCEGGSGRCRHGLIRKFCDDRRCQHAAQKRIYRSRVKAENTNPTKPTPNRSCEHQRNLSYCAICKSIGGGGGLCIHGKRRYRCSECRKIPRLAPTST